MKTTGLASVLGHVARLRREVRLNSHAVIPAGTLVLVDPKAGAGRIGFTVAQTGERGHARRVAAFEVL